MIIGARAGGGSRESVIGVDHRPRFVSRAGVLGFVDYRRMAGDCENRTTPIAARNCKWLGTTNKATTSGCSLSR